MARANFGPAIRELGRIFGAGTVAGLAEGQLLERFVARRDEVAFEALVARHGPMVLGVCRRLLNDPHDVDDAFQATFLVLVRKAGSIRDPNRLGPWLYGVAHRVARRFRARGARRREREQGGAVMAAHEPSHEPIPDDLGAELHEEIARLPDRYRAPLVLCDLGGCTHEEAARRLGWPVGTVKGRQSRARDLLRQRLSRRGITPSVGAITATLAADAHAAIPPALLQSTVRAAMSLAAGGTTAAAGLASASAVSVASEVSRAMILIKLKVVAAGLMSLGVVASGVGAYSLQDQGGGGAAAQEKVEAKEKPAGEGEAKDQRRPPFGAGFGRPDEAKGGPATPEIASARKALAEARINIARQQFETQFTHLEQGIIVYGGGMGGGMGGGGTGVPGFGSATSALEAAQKTSLNIVRVQEEALGGDFDLKFAIAEHLQRMERMRELVQNPDSPLNQQGILVGGPAVVDYYIAEARLWQAEAEAGLEPITPPGSISVTAIGEVVTSGGRGEVDTPGGDIDPMHLDRRTRSVLAALEQPLPMPFPHDTPLEDVLQYIKSSTENEDFPNGLPIYVDPLSLLEAEVTLQSPVQMDLEGVPLKTTLRLLLQQIRLNYIVKEGVVIIGSPSSQTFSDEAGISNPGATGGVPGYGLVPPGGFPPPQTEMGGFR